jgi:broad specificity phosphatase PhoE
MSTTIHYVRHGENPANLTREFSHKIVDYSLTEVGVAQARETAVYLRDKPIAAVYSSPLIRARETAAIIAEAHGLIVIELEEFREVNVGTLEGRPPTDEIWAFHDGIFDAWFAGDTTVRFPDGEDQAELLARMRAGLLHVAQHHPDDDVVVVAHGGILMASINLLCPEAQREPGHVPNCSVTVLEAVAENGDLCCRLLAWADCAHLS